MDSCAALRASASCSADWFTLYGICAYGTRSGGSNIPSRNRVSINRVTATSIACSVIRPSASAFFSARYVVPHSRSHPRCTPSAAASSGVDTILCVR